MSTNDELANRESEPPCRTRFNLFSSTCFYCPSDAKQCQRKPKRHRDGKIIIAHAFSPAASIINCPSSAGFLLPETGPSRK